MCQKPSLIKSPQTVPLVLTSDNVYYPGTEELKPDEIRLTACGTGLPAARRGQAATCFLMELGNGDKFLFDVGTGSMANVASYMIPYDFLDKVFITHLHTDHWGDMVTLWAGGWTSGRTGSLKVWGPSGQTEDMGTKYAVENFLKAYNWDAQTRNFKLNPAPGKIEVTEFAILSIAKTPPFSICDDSTETSEDIRLKYRYLDIRRGELAEKLTMRHKAMMATRTFLDNEGFFFAKAVMAELHAEHATP